MAKGRELKRRIVSVRKTRQITRTMEMVSTSKLKRATDRVHSARPYADALGEVIARLYTPELAQSYPLLRQPKVMKRAAVLLVTSNRGLAGAFNTNLIREARALMKEIRATGAEAELHAAGKKGVAYFRFLGEPMETQRVDIGDKPSADDAASLVDTLISRFEAGELDAIYVVYANFKSVMSTPPARMKVLPIEPPAKSGTTGGDPILSPSGDEILNKVLPLYARNAVYRAMVETVAAEHAARRTAMKNATDNAGDMLDILTRTYNRARQAQITQEIAEIVGGAAALE